MRQTLQVVHSASQSRGFLRERGEQVNPGELCGVQRIRHFKQCEGRCGSWPRSAHAPMIPENPVDQKPTCDQGREESSPFDTAIQHGECL